MIKKILGWIFIPYVMLGIILKRKTNNTLLGIVVGIISFFIWIGVISNLGNDNDIKTSSSQDMTKTSVNSKSDKNSSKPKATIKPEPTMKPTPKPTLSPKEIERRKKVAEKKKFKEWVDSQFSAWDGSHRALVDLVKENMNDPNSFKHVETRYSVKPYGLYIIMKYRGTNAFGGVITNYCAAKANYKKNTITIVANE